MFLATDSVTAPTTHSGKLVYGFLIGVLALLIRTVSPAHPEGVMPAILAMNVAAPLIDRVFVARNVRRRLARG